MLVLLALCAATVTHAQRPIMVSICAPMGNQTYVSLTVASTELPKYPGYVKGTCAKNCPTLCTNFPSFHATGTTCRCNGAAIKCGINAKASANNKQGCVCQIGYKGDAYKGCTDFDECAAAIASNKTVCPVNQECRNTVGSFSCTTCGENMVAVKNKCQCKAGFQGDAIKGCTDINECLVPSNVNACAALDQKCENTIGSFACVACEQYEKLVDNVCVCQHGDGRGTNGKCDLYEACAARNNTFWWHWSTGCECLPGYEGDPMLGCTDIDECAQFNWCWGYQGWTGNPRSYECRNDVGLGYSCVACPSNQVTFSYLVKGDRCQCQAGFAPDANGTCQCIPGTRHCDNCGGPNTSMDRWNEFCMCKEGYEGDPMSAVGCVDIDECARGTHRCDIAHVAWGSVWKPYQCRNVIGTYECDPCGKNTRVVDMVNGRCECLEGIQGDPIVGCN
jgi:Calcium-binding EGF domain